MASSRDAVIIGGGIVGMSIAYHLARGGMKRVLVLEREEFLGIGSTARCAGGVRQQFSTPVNIALSKESVRQWKTFGVDLGVDFVFQQNGYLFLAETKELEERLRRTVALQQSLGVATQLLEPKEVRRRWPFLRADDVRLAAFGAEDGYTDPHEAVQGYAAGARRLGVEIRARAPVTEIFAESGRVRGVRVGDDRVETPVAINAAGPDAPRIARMAGIDLPAKPYRRQIFLTAPISTIPRRIPLTLAMNSGLYFRDETGGVMVGMINPDEPSSENRSVDDDWLLTMIETAMDRIPPLCDAEIQSSWAGLYLVTPDHLPVVGAVPDIDGMYMAVGFSGHGFMHAPAIGTVMAEQILHGAARTVDIHPLRLERFDDGDLVHEQNVF